MISEAALARLSESPACALVLSAHGEISERVPAGAAVLPGSFNPMHEGHWQLAAAAERRLGRPVIFEISVRNVDKPALGLDDIRTRFEQFRGRAALALTCAPLFAQKAVLFPRSVFVVGADTVVRLLEPRYYGGDANNMHEALTTIARADCRFLVAGRKNAERWISLEDIDLPNEFQHLFAELAQTEFRCDRSSSELRKSR